MRLKFGLAALLLAAAAMMMMTGTASAQIAGTDHDLTSTGSGRTPVSPTLTLSFICQPCHHPHPPTANVMTSIPLGNRTTYDTAGINVPPAYTVYDTATTYQTPEQPTGIDLLCLSCHDGTIGMDAYGGNNDTLALAMAANTANFGSNLGNEHPVSVDYDALLLTAATDFDTVVLAEGKGIKFFMDSTISPGKNMVRCASCHDPHGTTNMPFLRLTPDVLCGTCHLK